MKGRPVLVTGGAGFIGSHLVERLLREGKKVVVLDDCSTGKLHNLRAVRHHPGLRVKVGKISECKGLTKLVRETESIYHLAAAVGVKLVVESPVHTIHTNLFETEIILTAAARAGTPILLASTSEVYGKSQKPAFSETDDLLIGPPQLGRWSYACSKLMDEFLALAYAKEQGLPVIIARVFNTVGPRQTGRYGMVLPRFIEAAKTGKPLPIYGSGQQKRCFCYVADTVEAFVRLQNSRRFYGEVFNVGTTEETSIVGLAELVLDVIGSKSKLDFIPYEAAYEPGFEDMLRRKPLIEKLVQATGFRPATSLREIVEKTVKSA